MNTPNILPSRREAVKTGAAALLIASLVPRLLCGADSVAKPAPLHRYDNYGWLRGFNVVPS